MRFGAAASVEYGKQGPQGAETRGAAGAAKRLSAGLSVGGGGGWGRPVGPATTRSPGRSSGLEWLPIHDSSDQRDSPDSAEPRLRNDPLEMSDPKDPIEPIDSTDPALPMDRMEYADPIDRIDPSDLMDRIDRDERRLRIDLYECSTVAISPVYHSRDCFSAHECAGNSLFTTNRR